jgi:hypothetical protein
LFKSWKAGTLNNGRVAVVYSQLVDKYAPTVAGNSPIFFGSKGKVKYDASIIDAEYAPIAPAGATLVDGSLMQNRTGYYSLYTIVPNSTKYLRKGYIYNVDAKPITPPTP